MLKVTDYLLSASLCPIPHLSALLGAVPGRIKLTAGKGQSRLKMSSRSMSFRDNRIKAGARGGIPCGVVMTVVVVLVIVVVVVLLVLLLPPIFLLLEILILLLLLLIIAPLFLLLLVLIVLLVVVVVVLPLLFLAKSPFPKSPLLSTYKFEKHNYKLV